MNRKRHTWIYLWGSIMALLIAAANFLLAINMMCGKRIAEGLFTLAVSVGCMWASALFNDTYETRRGRRGL